MASDNLLYAMDEKNCPEEWFDFDNCFKYLVNDLDSALMSTNSPSGGETWAHPTTFTDDLTSSNLHCSQQDPACFTNYKPQPENIYEDSGAVSFPDPDIHTMFDHTAGFPEADFDRSTSHNYPQNESIIQLKSAVRNLVYSKAAADPSCISRKEKRRDAAIALHLQRLRDTCAEDAGFVSDSSITTLSSPRSAQWSQTTGVTSLSPSTAASPVSSSKAEVEASRSEPVTGGVEMVLDLNMNVTTRLPKKQKPRTRAQRESYIIVRRHGACEKHRKQHKKCNCLEKASSRITSGGRARAQALQSVRGQKLPVEESYCQQFVPCHSEDVPIECSDTVEPCDLEMSRNQRYICLMPGCTYSSRTVSSLQQHYSRHSFHSLEAAPVRPQIPVHQRSSHFASRSVVSNGSLPSVPEIIPTGVRRRAEMSFGGRSLLQTAGASETSPHLDYNPSHTSSVDVSAGTPSGQTQSEAYGNTEKLWHEWRWRTSLSGPGSGCSSQHVRTDRLVGTALLADLYGYLVHSAISALISFLQFAFSISCRFGSYFRAAAVVSFGLRVVADTVMRMRPLLP